MLTDFDLSKAAATTVQPQLVPVFAPDLHYMLRTLLYLSVYLWHD
jgi:hypothetical protein